MLHKQKNEINRLLANINNGLRLAFFKRSPLGSFYISVDQAFLLVIFYGLVTFFGSFYLSLPKPSISYDGLYNIAAQLLFALLLSYALSKFSKEEKSYLSIIVVLFSLLPWFYIAWLILGKAETFDYWEFGTRHKYLYLIYSIWLVSAFLKAILLFVPRGRKYFWLTLLTFVLLFYAPLHYLYFGSFWYHRYTETDHKEPYRKINIENTYYRQFDLIQGMNAVILPERKNITDLYFIGFGGYASEDVFMKEVNYIKALFDNRFSTKGRSVALINNLKTMDTTPLASKSNLDLVVQHIGKTLNPQEDILFLYLTSHGSKQHRLSIDFVPLRLNPVDPNDLKEMLDRSGIKYRVLVVSACYSGGFIETLKDDHSLIITSSAPDKESFGCSHESEFTYLGKAIFDEHLRHSFDFIDAFHKAIVSIQKREAAEGREPSEPQLFIGEKIRGKLEKLSAYLANYRN